MFAMFVFACTPLLVFHNNNNNNNRPKSTHKACTYVTESVKRDLNSLSKMHVFQGSVILQRYAQSKSNTGILRRRRCCSNDTEMKS